MKSGIRSGGCQSLSGKSVSRQWGLKEDTKEFVVLRHAYASRKAATEICCELDVALSPGGRGRAGGRFSKSSADGGRSGRVEVG